MIKGNVIAELKRIKAEDGPRLQVHGSIELIQTLLAHDLVDEFRLLTFPVVLGAGRRLFGDKTVPTNLKHVRSKTSERGVVMSIYRRQNSATLGVMGRGSDYTARTGGV
ncbi:MAG: dihydrofolate reductase family protein [Rhodobacteraceae bacterium]|nr:dihydrofolate reductase family protein [Paracoccaceae bacterium]